MTYEEAIKTLTDIFKEAKEGVCYVTEVDCEALGLAIKSLEKQIPKPVKEWDIHSYGTPYYCPECVSDITPVEFMATDGSEPKEKVSYCWKCGQALDWSE